MAMVAPRPGLGQGHRLRAHTADVGFDAWAPGLERLFEEAATALAAIAADLPPGDPSLVGKRCSRVRLEAGDLEALAFAWLNELIAEMDRRHRALGATTVDAVAAPPIPAGAWHLRGRAWYVPYGPDVVARVGVKSATFHRLGVRPTGTGWTLSAFLDV